MALGGAIFVASNFILASKVRERLGLRAWLMVANPALYIGFAGDTAEPMAMFFLGLALAVGAVWAGAVLGVTRPDWLIATLWRWKPFLGGVAAAVLLGLYAVAIFGFDGMVATAGRLGVPFGGYLAHPSAAGWLLAAFALATVARGLQRRDWAWVAVGTFVLCFSDDVLMAPVNAWRVAGLIPVLWAFGTGAAHPFTQPAEGGVRPLP
jgi:hypothetical protein